MRVLGIDPGLTRCGLGVVDGNVVEMLDRRPCLHRLGELLGDELLHIGGRHHWHDDNGPPVPGCLA